MKDSFLCQSLTLPSRQKANGVSVLLPLLFLISVWPQGRSMAAQQAENSDDRSATAIENKNSDQIAFARMPASQIRSELTAWLVAANADKTGIDRILHSWSDDNQLAQLSGEELLDLLMESFSLVDSAAQQVVQEATGAAPSQELIFDGIRSEPIYRNQVQLFRARWLTQHKYFDEALPLFDGLSPDDVIDPASLLFYRAVCQSQLLQRQNAIDSINLLLHNTLDVPHRFEVVAQMLLKELSDQKDDGMDQVARLMKDVERRLELGRPGEETQKQEDAIIAALDKLLEDMEQQSQQQSGGGNGGSQQNQGGTQGASQSRVGGAPADGVADRKELTETGKWGMLNAKTEARARELIRQKFPPNFLDQIGRYTRKLAEQQK